MNFLSLIEAKRDGHALTAGQIRSLVEDYTRGGIPDYQMAAFLMAVCFRGLNPEETTALTLAMRDSGESLSLPAGYEPIVDKHSTGGVGDKVSLPLTPLLACLDLRVPMISGRGLGITGGTLDKLDSIPGFQTMLEPALIRSIVGSCGCVICGQTDAMVPADRKLYALRDATGTVPSIPLIVASILSKKLAEGLNALVLDVKFGSAAFMRTREQALALAQSMIELAGQCGLKARALLTRMDAPLGRAAGNWLEVKEAALCLENRGPDDLQELVVACAANLLEMTGRASSASEAERAASECLASGRPARKWREMLAAQGADVQAFEAKLQLDHTAASVREVVSPRSGYVAGCDARAIGELVRDLGGGRAMRDSKLDYEVGVDCLAKPGEQVTRGALLGRVHARNESAARDGSERLSRAVEIALAPPAFAPAIAEVLN